MKKYKFQCDNSNCNHQFIDDNPSICPKCKKDDFTILSQVNSNQKYIMISVAILVAVSAFVIYKFISDPVIVVTDKSDNLLSITSYANYFEIEDYEDFDEVNVFSIDDVFFSHEKSKVFPCESGEFKIYVSKGDVSEEKIEIFKLTGKPDKNACKTKLELISIYADMSECVYKIKTNDNKNVLVSLNKNSGFNNKLKWSFDECRNSDNFYLKLKGSNDIITERIENASCPNKGFNTDVQDVLLSSFKLYIKDISTNRSQFSTTFIRFDHPELFMLDNSAYALGDFIPRIKTMYNVDPTSVESLKLNISDIKYNEITEKVTLKISR
jgi:hypothetical protein